MVVLSFPEIFLLIVENHSVFLRVLQNLFGRLGFLDTAFQSGVLFDERLPFRLQPPQLRGFGAYHLRIDADDRQHDDNQRGKRRHHHFSETAEAVALLPVLRRLPP